MLIGWALDNGLPTAVREAAGEKAVERTEDLKTLAEWTKNLLLPVSVKSTAGLKAIHKAVKLMRYDLLEPLKTYPMVPDDVVGVLGVLARPKTLGAARNPLERNGTLSQGTVRPPAGNPRELERKGRVSA